MSPVFQTLTVFITPAARLTALCAALATSATAFAEQGPNPTPSRREGAPKIYAQDLVERTAAKHSELTSLEIHAKPPDDLDSLVIASTDPARIRHKSSEDDIRVFETGAPRVEVNDTMGGEVRTSVQLKDVARRPIGSAARTLPYRHRART